MAYSKKRTTYLYGQGCGTVNRPDNSDIRGPRVLIQSSAILSNVYSLQTVQKNDENEDKEDGKGEFLLFHTKPTFIKRGKSSFIRSFTLLFTVIISWPIYSQHFNKIAWESLQGIYVGRYTSKQLFRPTWAKQRNFKFKPSLSQQFLY